MINQYGFKFGFELEVNNVTRPQAVKIVSDYPFWDESPDGSGWEFKTRKAFTDLDEFMVEVGSLTAELRKIQARVCTKDNSPRGIHIHVSHPDRLISTRQMKHAAALAALWPTSWAQREHYCYWRVGGSDNNRSKYSAINGWYDGDKRHIEIRAYNATLNVRAISQMFLNAQKVANLVFEEVGHEANGKWSSTAVAGRRRRRRRSTQPLNAEA